MPAAWRLDRYLDADVEADEDISMASLRGHRLKYDKSLMRDDMARNDNVDDLKVGPRRRKAPFQNTYFGLHVQTLDVEAYLFLVYCICSPSQLGPIACFAAVEVTWLSTLLMAHEHACKLMPHLTAQVEDPLALKGNGKGEAYNRVLAKEKRKEREWTKAK